MKLGPYAKMIVAALGSAITAALSILPHDSKVAVVLTIASAFLTTLAVYLVPNAPSAP